MPLAAGFDPSAAAPAFQQAEADANANANSAAGADANMNANSAAGADTNADANANAEEDDEDEENSLNKRLIPKILAGLESSFEEEEEEAANDCTPNPDGEFDDVLIEFEAGVVSTNFLEEIEGKNENVSNPRTFGEKNPIDHQV